jgi:tetratricopeptide (TPR) repeat protein
MMRTIVACCAGLLSLVLPATPLRAAEPGGRYAVLVGVRQYDRTELTPLDYTENDVTVMEQVLRNGGYRRVALLTQSRGAFEARYLPTAANIRRELKGLLEDRTEHDTVIVGFCGHGVQFAGSDEPYFCPMDAKLGDKKTLISLSEVYAEMKSCKARVKVLLSDSCRNDPLPRGTRSALAKQVFSPSKAERKKPPENVIALFSCSAGEAAYESKELKHGVFFYHLIQGLRGKAALGGGKAVTLGALTDYVQREVRDYVKDAVGAEARQRPELVGRFSGAVTLIELSSAVRSTDPKAIKELIDKGLEHLRDRNYRKTVEVMDRALKIDGTSAMALAVRAHAHDILGDRAGAMADANKALELDPNLAEPYYTRGNVYYMENNLAGAISEYSEAIKRNAKHQSAHYNRGRAKARLKQYAEAIADYTTTLQLNPNYTFALHARGLAHSFARDYDAALADYNRAIEANPKFASAYADRGFVYSMRGDDTTALADYSEAIRLDGKNAGPYNYRGNLYSRRKEYDKAVADFTEAIRKRPGYTAAVYNRGMAFFHKKDYRTAIADFNEAIRLDSKYAQAYNARGASQSRLGNKKAALADYTRAISFDSTDPLFFRNRGKLYSSMKEKQKAAEDQAMATKLETLKTKARTARR